MKSTERGISLVEVMVASGMLIAVAVTIYPLFFEGRKYVNRADFSSLCMNAVRSKLNEYRFGTPTTLTDGLTTDLAADASNKSNGFAYVKKRYNAEINAYCPQEGNGKPKNVSQLPPEDLNLLGRQECMMGTGGPLPIQSCKASSTVDDQLEKRLPGFKLFVNLRRYNPILEKEDCAMGPGNIYDFQQAGDMVKITVTGVLDLAEKQVYGGIDFNSPRKKELTCQLTEYLRPFSQVARYWLHYDGRIFRWQGTGSLSYEVFPVAASSNNQGLAVSPDNKYIYVLRPGTLVRYENCSGDPINCPLDSQKNWAVDPNIVSITAKWTGKHPHQPMPICGKPNLADGKPVLFGLLADRKTAVCLDLPGGPEGAQPPSNPPTLKSIPNLSGGSYIPFLLPVAKRVHSIFMDPQGLSTYFVDLTCFNFLNNTYCGGIYEGKDRELQYPLEAFNVRAIAFSK